MISYIPISPSIYVYITNKWKKTLLATFYIMTYDETEYPHQPIFHPLYPQCFSSYILCPRGMPNKITFFLLKPPSFAVLRPCYPQTIPWYLYLHLHVYNPRISPCYPISSYYPMNHTFISPCYPAITILSHHSTIILHPITSKSHCISKSFPGSLDILPTLWSTY